MEKKMEEIANQYFIAWNKQDLSELRNLFDKNIVLKDWDMKLAFTDIAWGGFVYFIASLLTNLYIKYSKN